MKHFLLILLIIVGNCVAGASVQADTAKTKARIRHIKELVTRQKTELNDTRSRLDLSLWTIKVATDQIAAVAKERDQWRGYGQDQHERFINAEKAVQAKKAAILRRDLIIGIMSLLIGAYGVLKFYFHIPFL